MSIALALCLGGCLVGVLIHFTPSRSLPQPDRQDEAKVKLEEEREALQRERQQLEVARLMHQANERLQNNDHAGAQTLYQKALALVPGHPEAEEGLRKALAGPPPTPQVVQAPAIPAPVAPPAQPASVDPAKEEPRAGQRLAAEVQRQLEAGRTALLAGQLEDALQAFAAALQLMPENLEAQQGQKQVEARLAGLADKERRRKTFENFLERGRRALADRRFKEALASLEPAMRLVPDDREGQRMLRQAREGLRVARLTQGLKLQQIEEAVRGGRLAEAQRLADEALRNWPEDTQTQQVQQRVTKLVEQAQGAQAAYLQLVQQGRLAMTGQRYGEAVNAFTEALRLAPLDLDIQRNLRMARAALERDLRTRGDYERTYRAATLALGRGAYADAMRLFNEALRVVPDDLPAMEGVRRARYGQAMVQGQQALQTRRRADALSAFQAALTERPGDLQATQGLRQAQLLR
ncbi:MAG: hypothetical protein U0840_27050 [Gemmataceae bacterium]